MTKSGLTKVKLNIGVLRRPVFTRIVFTRLVFARLVFARLVFARLVFARLVFARLVFHISRLVNWLVTDVSRWPAAFCRRVLLP